MIRTGALFFAAIAFLAGGSALSKNDGFDPAATALDVVLAASASATYEIH